MLEYLLAEIVALLAVLAILVVGFAWFVRREPGPWTSLASWSRRACMVMAAFLGLSLIFLCTGISQLNFMQPSKPTVGWMAMFAAIGFISAWGSAVVAFVSGFKGRRWGETVSTPVICISGFVALAPFLWTAFYLCYDAFLLLTSA